MNFRILAKSIGDIGLQHCRTSHEFRSTRISNYISASGSILIFLYFIASCFQFHFQYKGYLLFQLSLVFVLSFNLYLNHRGYMQAAKIIGLLCSIVYIVVLNFIAGNQMGGAYMLLVTSILPMILFEDRRMYTLFFLLHILAFFINYQYQLTHSAIIEMAAEDIPVSYCSAVLVMFLALYLIMQHFLHTNQAFEKEITQSKSIIEAKNRSMLDSIEYARRIQQNILPPLSDLKNITSDFSILYLPKDIVSGDFYWFREVQDEEGKNIHLVAACDCTGHGVPGALVSVVCSNALDKAIREFRLLEPDMILDKVNELVSQELGKKMGSEQNIPDGMDISLCRIDLDKLELCWAGAQNPLWIIRNSEIKEWKADKHSIGNMAEKHKFSRHNISLQAGDAIIMFSDGFADQFGGPSGKKLTRQGFRNMLLKGADQPMNQLFEKLKAGHAAWKKGFDQVDDICVIGLRI